MEAEVERADCREMVRDITHAFLPTRQPPGGAVSGVGGGASSHPGGGSSDIEFDAYNGCAGAGPSAGAAPSSHAGAGPLARAGIGAGVFASPGGRSTSSTDDDGEATPATHATHRLAMEAAVVAGRSDMLQEVRDRPVAHIARLAHIARIARIAHIARLTPSSGDRRCRRTLCAHSAWSLFCPALDTPWGAHRSSHSRDPPSRLLNRWL